MSPIQAIVQKFRNQEMESFEFQKSIFELYKEGDKNQENQQAILNIIGSFNDIGLYGYMDSFKDKCIHSRIEFQNGFIFNFDCYEKLNADELKQAHSDFLGQLSDGWGSNASQINLLIGKEKVYLDWDMDNVGEWVVKSPKTLNANKPK
jgi:hypothetical protein